MWPPQSHNGGHSVLLEAEKWVNGPLGARGPPQIFFRIARNLARNLLKGSPSKMHIKCSFSASGPHETVKSGSLHQNIA